MPSLLDAPKLSREEIAEKFGVHPISVDRWVRVGLRGHRLPRIKLGGRSYFLVADVERFIRATSDNMAESHDPTAEEEHDSAMAECAALGL